MQPCQHLSSDYRPDGLPAAAPEGVRVFQPGPDLSSPEILPLSETVSPPKHCKEDIKGKVVLGAVIDAQGKARNLHFLSATGTYIDNLALLTADADRFKPGIRMSAYGPGVPVAVAQAIQLQITGCILREDQSDGTKLNTVHLKASPRQTLLPDPDASPLAAFGENPSDNANPNHGPWALRKVGKDASEPRLIKYVDAQYPDQGRRQKIQGKVVLSLIVDSNGMPRQIKVVSSMGLGFDENAVAAVSSYRFGPALHGNQPVAVPIAVQVKFRLY